MARPTITITRRGEDTRELTYGEDGGVKKGGAYIYWRKSDGTIIFGPNTPSERMEYESMGFTPLDKYGTFRATAVGWSPMREPFRQLIALGGEVEFTAEQIIDNGWHRKPPYDGIVFPQLEGVETHDVQCAVCNKWLKDSQRLGVHMSVIHQDRSQTDALSRNLTKAMSEVNGPMAEVLKALAERIISGDAQAAEARKDARIAELENALATKTMFSTSEGPVKGHSVATPKE